MNEGGVWKYIKSTGGERPFKHTILLDHLPTEVVLLASLSMFQQQQQNEACFLPQLSMSMLPTLCHACNKVYGAIYSQLIKLNGIDNETIS